jgi:hypothetical protein
MNFYAKEMQDRFALSLIGKEGYFLDLGCRGDLYNNTKALEERGWTGLLFDIEKKWIDETKRTRTSPAFCVDVTSDEFLEILNENAKKKIFDYVSMDVDAGSVGALNNFFDGGYSFKVITFEHDLYATQERKGISKNIFEENGYFLLFENVLSKKDRQFEDWWIHPYYFEDDIKSLKSDNLRYSDCVSLVENRHG